MVYYSNDSEQYVSWNKLKDPSKKDGFTTEALAQAAEYEALRVWEEYVKGQGTIKGKQARELVRTVVDGWIVLQVAIRNDPGVNIDYKVAQNEAKQGAIDALEDATVN